MNKYTIEVSKTALNKIVRAGIKHTVTDSPNALRDLLADNVNNWEELDDHDQACIIDEAIKAHAQGEGLEVEVYLGRDCNDERNYTYMGCEIGAKYPDITFNQLDKLGEM